MLPIANLTYIFLLFYIKKLAFRISENQRFFIVGGEGGI